MINSALFNPGRVAKSGRRDARNFTAIAGGIAVGVGRSNCQQGLTVQRSERLCERARRF